MTGDSKESLAIREIEKLIVTRSLTPGMRNCSLACAPVQSQEGKDYNDHRRDRVKHHSAGSAPVNSGGSL